MRITIKKNEIVFSGINKNFSLNTSASIAANMREAIKAYKDMLKGDEDVEVMLNVPAVIVPEELAKDEDTTALYNLSVSTPKDEEQMIINCPVPQLHVVALYAVSKDLNTVLEDNFKSHEFKHILIGNKEFNLQSKSLHAFFCENNIHIYYFKGSRLHYFNTLNADTTNDRMFYLLSVWKQFGLNQLKDTLELSGDIPEKEALTESLKEFIKKVTICE